MIGCIIQARIGSERLPRKILKKIDDKNTILDYVINQTSNSKKIKKIVVATTELNEDDIVAKFCNDREIDCFRGSVDDVLDRHYQCAKKYSFNPIVRVTSDNPIVDPEIIDLCINTYEKGQFDMVIAMYHDQGHIPLKLTSMDEGVNVTLGIPIVRTSVDHGTAYDIAGKNLAREASLCAAFKMAARLAQTKEN